MGSVHNRWSIIEVNALLNQEVGNFFQDISITDTGTRVVKSRCIDQDDCSTTVFIVKSVGRDVDGFRIDVMSDNNAFIACQELDEL